VRHIIFENLRFNKSIWFSSRVKMDVVFPQAVKTKDRYQSALKFFEEHLRADSECRLEDEYPLAFHASQLDHIFVSHVKAEHLAGLVTLERSIEYQRHSHLRALFVGSVVTAPKARQQGLQRQLFHAIEEASEQWGIDVIVLWSSQIEFYKKLGFDLGGLQASWFASFPGTLAEKSTAVRVGSTIDIPFSSKFFESFSKKIFCVQRTENEMQRLWQIPKMLVACTGNAYALVGKGEDFQGVCHEWAGPADEVLACIDALRERVANLRILSPGIVHTPDENGVVEALERASFECRLEYLGLFKTVSDRVKMADLSPEDLKLPFFIWGLDSI
jgi:GNAT superfamily N-acetyltransferase